MRRMIAWAGRVAFGAVVAVALGFGGQQVFASAGSVETDCQPCETTPECRKCCIEEMDADDGICYPPACFCIKW